MDQPLPAEDEHIEVVPFVIFALVLLVPFLNFQFTFYRTLLKLFVFQTAAAVLWCTLLWQWGGGRLRGGAWPAWWLFAPLGLWVAWGLATAAWSSMGWLCGQWVVQGLSGLVGAVGLSVLLRDRALRRMFVTASGAVAFVVALLMAVFYGDPWSGFFGDLDVAGREVGAAFLLVPTLVAAALLHGRPAREAEDEERAYQKVIWLALLLVVLLVAGIRTGSAAWLYGLGVGVAVGAWLLVPRWRLLAAVLAVLVVVLLAGREARLRAAAAGAPWQAPTRQALLHEADWALVRDGSIGRRLVGQGVGTLPVALDLTRPPATYAVPFGDKVEDHARRAATEVLYERGIVGLAFAALGGLACVVAGVLTLRRAGDRSDGALGAGLAAGVVAMGVYACLSHGVVSFGAGMAFWVAAGLLGALSASAGHGPARGWSAEEALARREAPSRGGGLRRASAVAALVVVVAGWFVIGARPFWAGYLLREGRAELEVSRRLGAQRASAAGLLAGLRRSKGQSVEEFAEARQRAEENLRQATAEHAESVRRADSLLRSAGRRSLDGRVWLNAQLSLARGEMARDEPEAAAQRYAALHDRCGPVFDLDVLRAECYERLGKPEQAHLLYHRYARKNPLAAQCTLFRTNTRLYAPWLRLIERQRRKPQPDPRWRSWARDFSDACADGLAVFPDHYGLLLLHGEMFYRLGRDEESFDLLVAAANVIRYRLAIRPYSPRTTASLLLELANACSHWDKATALSAVNRIGTLNIDFSNPSYAGILDSARALILALDPGTARLAQQEAARRARAARQSPLRPRTGPPSTATRPATATPTTASPSPPAPATRTRP